MKLVKAGESHGEAVVGIIENVPSGIKIDESALNAFLCERNSAYGRGARQKDEKDEAKIIAGVIDGVTTGGNVAFAIQNKVKTRLEHTVLNGAVCVRDLAGEKCVRVRPGHADLAGLKRFGFDDSRYVSEGASARSTCADVAAGYFALEFLKGLGVSVCACVAGVADYDDCRAFNFEMVSAAEPPLYLADKGFELAVKNAVACALNSGDTLGGKVVLAVKGVKAGFGSYVYEKRVDGAIAARLMSVQAVKGVYFGLNPFENRSGSAYIDSIRFNRETNEFFSEKNNCGGVSGGMTDGNEIVITAGIKPVPTLPRGVETVDYITGETVIADRPRSDVSAVFACVPILKSALALALTEIICERTGCDDMRSIALRYGELR